MNKLLMGEEQDFVTILQSYLGEHFGICCVQVAGTVLVKGIAALLHVKDMYYKHITCSVHAPYTYLTSKCTKMHVITHV